MTRFEYLRQWWKSARSTYQEASIEEKWWVLFTTVGAFTSLRNSVAVLYFMSGWALVKGAGNQKAQAKREMLEEKSEETRKE